MKTSTRLSQSTMRKSISLIPSLIDHLVIVNDMVVVNLYMLLVIRIMIKDPQLIQITISFQQDMPGQMKQFVQWIERFERKNPKNVAYAYMIIAALFYSIFGGISQVVQPLDSNYL